MNLLFKLLGFVIGLLKTIFYIALFLIIFFILTHIVWLFLIIVFVTLLWCYSAMGVKAIFKSDRYKK